MATVPEDATVPTVVTDVTGVSATVLSEGVRVRALVTTGGAVDPFKLVSAVDDVEQLSTPT